MVKPLSKLKQTLTLCLFLRIAFIPLSPVPAFSLDEKQELLTEKTNLCVNNLKTNINNIINRPELERSRWGIVIKTLNSQTNIYSLNGDKYFVPASNVKLLTTAAALLKLGPAYRIRTSVYATGVLPDLTSLRIVGRGDPTLTTNQLRELATQLKNQGVRNIENLIVDDSYFPQPVINPTWEWEDIHYYYAPRVNSLILNENIVTLTLFPQDVGQALSFTWSDVIAGQQWWLENNTITAEKQTPSKVTINGFLGKPKLEIQGKLAANSEPDIWYLAVLDPANYFLETWKNILLSEGINIKKNQIIKVQEDFEKEQEIASIFSPALPIILNEINQESNNLFTESIANILNKEQKDTTKQTLTELGVNPDSYHLADASGLSRHNLVSPRSLVETLELMSQTPLATVYRESLAVAGVSGTLVNRFSETAVQGNLQGKTGTLTGVTALSGYLNLPQHQPLVFSIIVNRSQQPASVLRGAIDEIILLLSERNLNQECNF